MRKMAVAVVLLALVGAGAYLALRPAPEYSDATDQFKAVRLSADGLEPVTVTASDRPYLAVYHTALWCGPSERFSQALADFYRTADKSRFQLVVKSYDRSDEELIEHMKKYGMDCPFIPFTVTDEWGIPPDEIGIPNLVIINTATRRVVDQRYHKGLFGLKNVGPDVPLETLKRLAGQ